MSSCGVRRVDGLGAVWTFLEGKAGRNDCHVAVAASPDAATTGVHDGLRKDNLLCKFRSTLHTKNRHRNVPEVIHVHHTNGRVKEQRLS